MAGGSAEAQWRYAVSIDAAGDKRLKSAELRIPKLKRPLQGGASLAIRQVVNRPDSYDVVLMLTQAQHTCGRACDVFIRFPGEPGFIRYDGSNASIGSLAMLRIERAEAIVLLAQQPGEIVVRFPGSRGDYVDLHFTADHLLWPLPLEPEKLAPSGRPTPSTGGSPAGP